MTSQQKRIVRREALNNGENLPSELPEIVKHLYCNRGIEDPIQLDRSTKQLLGYQTLLGIDEACHLLADSIENKEKLLIVGDFDADGATSTTLALLALRALGAVQVDYLVPNRFEFGYGLSPEIVEVAKLRNPDVIVTVDNGISSIEGVQAARDAGIQVVVTDHHLEGDSLPNANAIVNPNQKACPFPSKAACGCGVIFYVMVALKAELKKRNWFERTGLAEPNMADYLDIVALGTVADVVPLDHNNRIFIHQGLSRIRAGKARPGILALLDVAGKQKERIVASDLGFAVGPRLNAAGRLDDMSMGIECLLADNPQKAREIAQTLDEMNQDRKSIEQGMQEQAMAYLSKFREIENTEELPWGLCIFEKDWHEGVIGILASRIKDKLHRPVIAFALNDKGEVKGSARSIPGFHIRDGLDAVAKRHPHILKKFGGHAMAAGMSFKAEYFEEFKQAFDEEVRRQLSENDLEAQVMSDGELAEWQLNMDTARVLQEAGPWGQAFPEPIFDGVFTLIQQRIVGQKHLKLMLQPEGSEMLIGAIAFNVDLDVWPSDASKAQLAYKLDINEFRGNQSLQLMVDYLEPVR